MPGNPFTGKTWFVFSLVQFTHELNFSVNYFFALKVQFIVQFVYMVNRNTGQTENPYELGVKMAGGVKNFLTRSWHYTTE